MTTDSMSLSRRPRVLPPGTYRMPGVTAPAKPRPSKLAERASAVMALQLDPKMRAAFLAWAMMVREGNPQAKRNLNRQLDRLFYELDGPQMLKLAHVIGTVQGQ